jgi:hypothetical protein
VRRGASSVADNFQELGLLYAILPGGNPSSPEGWTDFWEKVVCVVVHVHGRRTLEWANGLSSARASMGYRSLRGRSRELVDDFLVDERTDTQQIMFTLYEKKCSD